MEKQIPNHSDYYVTPEGKVISHKGTKPRELKPDYYKGYARVKLDGDNIYISQLVLDAFVGPRPHPLHEAFHIDGDNCNNNVCNLCWLSHSDVRLYSNYSSSYRQSDEFRKEVLGIF